MYICVDISLYTSCVYIYMFTYFFIYCVYCVYALVFLMHCVYVLLFLYKYIHVYVLLFLYTLCTCFVISLYIVYMFCNIYILCFVIWREFSHDDRSIVVGTLFTTFLMIIGLLYTLIYVKDCIVTFHIGAFYS